MLPFKLFLSTALVDVHDNKESHFSWSWTKKAPSGGNLYISLPLRDVRSVCVEGIIRLKVEDSGLSPANCIVIGLVDERGNFVYQTIKHVYNGCNYLSLDTNGISFLLNGNLKGEAKKYEKLRIIVKDLSAEVEEVSLESVSISDSKFPGNEDRIFFNARLASKEIRSLLSEYWLKPLIDPLKTAKEYLAGGNLVYMGGVNIGSEQGGLNEFADRHPTYIRRYHSLEHIRAMLEVSYNLDHDFVLLSCANSVDDWLVRYYDRFESVNKYVWYDHGTADRLVTMVRLLFEIDATHDEKFFKFSKRLRSAIYRHIEALADSSFYLRTQKYRYHNHGLFQDFALFVCCSVLEGFERRGFYLELASQRARRQFEALISSEGVSLENSAGYHKGMIKLVRKAEKLFFINQDNVEFYSSLANKMQEFLRVLRYPDGSLPAYGDTFRTLNSSRLNFKEQPVGVYFYPDAGYYIRNWKLFGYDCKLMVMGGSATLVHKHKDNLSFVLYYAGVEWLIDPGFYSHGQDAESLYSKGEYAHNSIILPGKTCIPKVGSCVLELLERNDGSALRGLSSDYNGVVIQRTFALNVAANTIRVDNFVTGDCDSGLMAFHLGDGVSGHVVNNCLHLSHPQSERVCMINLIGGCYGKGLRKYQSEELADAASFGGWTYHGTGEKKPIESWVVPIEKVSSFEIILE